MIPKPIGYFKINAKTVKTTKPIVMNHPNIKVTMKYVFSKLVTSNYPESPPFSQHSVQKYCDFPFIISIR